MYNFRKMVLSLHSHSYPSMKRIVEIKGLLITDAAGIYTFQFANKSQTEFTEFMLKFKNSSDPLIQDDFQRIIAMIQKISENGAYERLFRTNESKMKDNVVAIPLDIKYRKNHDTLRLYCVRLSDRILIIGNGDTKRGSYNNNPNIIQYTNDLVSIERAINYYIRKNQIRLDLNKIIIDNSVKITI